MRSLKYAALSTLSVLAFMAGPVQAQNWGQVLRAPPAAVLQAEPDGQPRYIVTAERLYANDETGRDWPGSDEIYLTFTDNISGGNTSIFGDFDTGETRNLPAGRWCLSPLFEPVRHQNGSLYGWQCKTGGIGGPFNFTVTVYESDSAYLPFYACLYPLPSGVECQDDRVGSRTISYTRQELESAMPNIGDSVAESARMGGYTLTWRVTRIADSGTPPVIN